jgi:D-xylose transport system substrate-binding protein
MVGELMAGYALQLKPKGNYIILNGPSTDNNAALVRQGVMNKLTPAITKGDVKVLTDKEMDSWGALSAFFYMQDFLSTNKKPIDAIITAGDDMVSGTLEAIQSTSVPILTGQNATVEACQNIMRGFQTMTVYKDFEMLSTEGALLAMKIAKGEKVQTTKTTSNGKINVPSILFDPMVIDKNNLRMMLVPRHITEEQLQSQSK